MRIKHHDLIIDAEDPFLNCKLNRGVYAQVLTSIVSTYAEGFVLAINNEWGTGKTTFVRMWEQQLKNDGFQTLYFNAWENDFGTNPLAALIGELQPLKKKNRKKFNTVLEKGAVITKSALPKIAKAITSKYIDVEGVVEAIEGATEGMSELLAQEVSEYSKKKNGLKEFRQKLASFIEDVKGDKPLIFIIDELDRCRPNYSVELLEQVKHFFSVPGIVFVLSIDKKQLGNAVRGVYGSDLINADEYLRRFIDVEYSVPPPNSRVFCRYLFDYFEFGSFFHSEERLTYRELNNDSEMLIDVAAALFEKSSLSLRQQEKIFAHVRIGLNHFKKSQYVFPGLYLILVYLKNFQSEFYQGLQQKKFSLDSLLAAFHKLLPQGIQEEQREYFIHIEALLVFMYNNFVVERSRRELVTKDEESGKLKSIVLSKIDLSEEQYSFTRYLRSFVDSSNFYNLGIEFLTKKVDLIDNIVI